ncbi:hypothetical protein [Agromyces italicus]|uniref:hypothetical protein n=1 Tax=Agromyces italicus TaxID=279572 RepID=UPI0004223FCD
MHEASGTRPAAPPVRSNPNSDFTELALWRSYAIVFRYINRVGLGERDPFECPLVTQRASI